MIRSECKPFRENDLGMVRFMKKNLTVKEYIYVGLMLFGMFFGAGNLIFPVSMGQNAGHNVWAALAGFLVTGVGLPLLGVAALGISKSNGLYELSSKAGKPFGMFFTVALYLSIGPFFAIPRCATTSFTVGLEQILPEGVSAGLILLIFSVVFFAAALAFSLKPGKILTWIGKILTPVFLVFLFALVIVALVNPSAHVSEVAPSASYADKAFIAGFIDGYGTMDALAGLAFGIVVVNVIRSLGVEDPLSVAGATVKSGILGCFIMSVIYVAVTIMGAESRGAFAPAENGGVALTEIARYYLGDVGLYVLAATVTFACLKTSVGLITSCSETFVELFPKCGNYKIWAIVFSLVSLVLTNFGLSAIINYSLPALMFLYPLTIALVLLSLFGRFYENARVVYGFTLGFTFIGAIYDLLLALPVAVKNSLKLDGFLEAVGKYLPLSDVGMGWICPFALGLVIGLTIYLVRKVREKDADEAKADLNE